MWKVLVPWYLLVIVGHQNLATFCHDLGATAIQQLGQLHPPGKVSATSVWHLNPTGTPRIREVTEVSAKVSISYWYAACQKQYKQCCFQLLLLLLCVDPISSN